MNTGNEAGVWNVFKQLTMAPHNNLPHSIKYFLFRPRYYCGLHYAAHYRSLINLHAVLKYADKHLIRVLHRCACVALGKHEQWWVITSGIYNTGTRMSSFYILKLPLFFIR